MIDASTLETIRAFDPPSRLMLQDGCVAKLVVENTADVQTSLTGEARGACHLYLS
jgi:hypothetical protein